MTSESTPSIPQENRGAPLLPPLRTAGAPPRAELAVLATSLGPLYTSGAGQLAEPVEPIGAVAAPSVSETAGSVEEAPEDDLALVRPWSTEELQQDDAMDAASPAWRSEEDGIELEGSSDWAEEYEMPMLGDTALEADEPLVLEDRDDIGGRAAELTSAFEALKSPQAGGGPDARAAEVADRLERIARTLREEGPTETLARFSGDPLGAMIAGYLIGLGGGGGGQDVRSS